MKSRITLFIIGFIIWMLLSWPPDLEHALAGIFAAVLVAGLTGDLFTPLRPKGQQDKDGAPLTGPRRFTRISRYLWFGYYIFLFSLECLKANIDVALRVANPMLPINPGIVKVKTTLKSDTALTFLANSITLTPGTLCVDIKPEEGFLYIHWIDVRAEDIEGATRLIVEKFERILSRIFE